MDRREWWELVGPAARLSFGAEVDYQFAGVEEGDNAHEMGLMTLPALLVSRYRERAGGWVEVVAFERFDLPDGRVKFVSRKDYSTRATHELVGWGDPLDGKFVAVTLERIDEKVLEQERLGLMEVTGDYEPSNKRSLII